MTKAEARAFIEAAEKQPTSEVDRRKLAEALEVLTTSTRLRSGQTAADANPWGVRALELAQRVGIVPRTATITSPEGVGRQSTSTTENLIPADLTSRFRAAAKDAGLSDVEVRGQLDAINQQLASDDLGGSRDLVLSQLEARIADLQGQVLAARPPIGVPPMFTATRSDPVFASGPNRVDDLGGLPTPARQVSRQVQPRYFDGDQFSPAGQDPARIARIQSELAAAGLLEEGEYWAGFWDAATSGAYKAVLGFSNQSGLTADEAIKRLQETLPESIKEARARKTAMETFQAPPFMKPDPARMAQDVKEAFRRRLGRDPTPEDLAEMTGALGSAHRAAYEAEVAAARSAFDASIRAGQTGQPQTVGTFQSVDPGARFAELFEQRYQPEIARFDAIDDVRMNQANMFASLRTMTSLIGG